MAKSKSAAKSSDTQKDITTLERLETEYVRVDSLQPNPYNSNRQSPHDFELLCRSMEENGFTQPIIVNRTTQEIVDGEHRWRAAQALGWEFVDVVFVEMSQAQQMVATLRHNRARGSENIAKAADVLREIQAMGLDALEGAADSLMLDDLDLKIMLEDIPKNELILRDPDVILSVDDVERLNQQEVDFESRKKQQEKAFELADDKKYTFTFVITWAESFLCNKVALGGGEHLNKAERLLFLSQKWEHAL